MLYLVAMLQPIMPLLEYHVNKEYIANVLCENRERPQLACNGKCYLSKKVIENRKETSHSHSVPKIDLAKYPITPISIQKTTYDFKDKKEKSIFYNLKMRLKKFVVEVDRPPTYTV